MLVFFRLFIPFLVLMCIPSAVYAINLNGSWSYRESGSETGETFREIRQNYSFGVGPALRYSPSHAIDANLSVSYTQENDLSGESSQVARTITPTAGLALKNDLFAFRVSANTTNRQRDNGNWASSSTWSTSLDSMWNQPFVPRLLFRYSEIGDDSTGAPISSLNTQRSNLGAGFDWDLQRADVSYRYSQADDANQFSSQSHFIKFQTAARFWDNRVTMRLSQQVQLDTQKTAAGSAGAATPITDRTLRYAISDTVTPVASVCGGLLIPAVECLDDEMFPIPYASGDFIQLGIDPPLSRQVGVVIISYDDTDLDFRNSTWDLYQFNDSGIPSEWTPIASANFTVTDLGDGRLRIEIAETARTTQDILLVGEMGTFAGQISRVDVFDVLPAGAELLSRNYKTSAGLSVRVTDNLSASVGLSYERDESETEGSVAEDFDSDRITTSGSLNWTPVSFLSTSVGATEYREIEMGEAQVINRNYSLVFSSRPTSTLNISLSTRLNERFGGGNFPVGQKTIESLSYVFSGKALIYPDLTASVSLSQETGKRWLEEDIAGVITGRFADESRNSGRLDLQADFYEDFTVDFISRYSQSETDGKANESGTVEVGMRYRVSELLLLRSSYKTDLVDSEKPDAINVTVLASVLATGRTRLNLELGHTQAEEASQSISANGSWEANKNISLTGRGGYSIAEVNSYFVLFDLRVGI